MAVMGNATPENPPKLPRRDLLGLGRRMGLGAVRSSAGVLSALAGTTGPLQDDAPEVDIGTPQVVAALEPGTVSTDFAGSGRFYLVRVAEGIVALDRRCPIQACAVLWRFGLPALSSDLARGWDR